MDDRLKDRQLNIHDRYYQIHKPMINELINELMNGQIDNCYD